MVNLPASRGSDLTVRAAIISETTTLKCCATCAETKPSAAFLPSRHERDRLTARCRSCVLSASAADRTAREARSGADLLAQLQTAAGARLIAKSRYSDLEGFRAFLAQHGAENLPRVRNLLAHEHAAGRRAGWIRNWEMVGRLLDGLRTCRVCGGSAPEHAFKIASRGKRCNMCKRCDAKRRKPLEKERARDRRRRETNGERIREINREASRRARAKYPERSRARAAASHAARSGKLVHPECCEADGCTVKANLQRHHCDYSKPLEVIWLCTQHHEACHHFGPVKLKRGAALPFARAPDAIPTAA